MIGRFHLRNVTWVIFQASANFNSRFTLFKFHQMYTVVSKNPRFLSFSLEVSETTTKHKESTKFTISLLCPASFTGSAPGERMKKKGVVLVESCH